MIILKLIMLNALFSLFFIPLFLLSYPSDALAQDYSEGQSAPDSTGISMPEILPPDYIQLPFGQRHFYTLNLRGNGQAIVFLKTVFSNTTEATMSAMQLTFPDIPENIVAFQAHREPDCISYKHPGPRVPIEIDYTLKFPYQYECARYSEPDYLYGWANTYHKTKYTLDGRKLSIELPKPVKPNGNGSLILTYSLPAIASKGILGEYNYHFKSVTSQEVIQNLHIGIAVDTDYYLKETRGEINYQSKEAGSFTAPAAMSLDSTGGISNSQFDQFYNQIGYGTVVKSVNNLQPNETYEIKGIYADNKAKLFAYEILIGGSILLIIIIIAFISLFIAGKKLLNKKDSTSNQPKSAISSSLTVVLATSFGSSLFVLLYTIGLYIFTFYLMRNLLYYAFNSIYPLLIILITVISLCIYGVFLFAPAVVIGIKKSIISGLATLILTILFLVFYIIIIAGISFLFFNHNSNWYNPPIMPMMGGIETQSVGREPYFPPPMPPMNGIEGSQINTSELPGDETFSDADQEISTENYKSPPTIEKIIR